MEKITTNFTKALVLSFLTALSLSCGETKEEQKEKKKAVTRSLEVTATAYNSTEQQTKKGNIGLAAWGDTLQPGERAIAVSRDLIKMGLDHNEEVQIDGLDGTYIVKDKMNKRWKKKIDIYMGLDEKAAREWGKKKVEISFREKDNPNDKFSEQAKDAG